MNELEVKSVLAKTPDKVIYGDSLKGVVTQMKQVSGFNLTVIIVPIAIFLLKRLFMRWFQGVKVVTVEPNTLLTYRTHLIKYGVMVPSNNLVVGVDKNGDKVVLGAF